MPKRRRVDVKLRLEEAKAAVVALEDVLALELVVDETRDHVAYRSRLRRVVAKLQAGIAFVTAGGSDER
jgi:hypothetical protein